MEQIGLPLHQLEEVAFGIPFPAYGVALDEPEFYEQNPELLPVLEAFGVHPNPNPYHIDVPDCVYKAGQMIAEDLEQHPDERYRQILWLLQWLFSASNNSLVLCGILKPFRKFNRCRGIERMSRWRLRSSKKPK